MTQFNSEINARELTGDFVLSEVSWQEFRPYFLSHRAEVFHDDAPYPVESFLSEDEHAKIRKLGAHTEDLFRLVYLIRNKENIAGWSWGVQRDREEYYMVNTGLYEEYRGQGVYKALLPHIMKRIVEEGFQLVTSRHNPENRKVIKPKLDYGFVTSGYDVTDRYGVHVILSYYFNEKRQDVLKKRLDASDAHEILRKFF